jgi:hypothetical protein
MQNFINRSLIVLVSEMDEWLRCRLIIGWSKADGNDWTTEPLKPLRKQSTSGKIFQWFQYNQCNQ